MLARAPVAELWLLRQPAEGEPHLRAELAACGIDARRVTFAPLVRGIADHISRTSEADLLIDTLEYSSHTTGSDALWAGVPMLTLPGETMASRVGGSLLRASGMSLGQVRALREYTDVASLLVAKDSLGAHGSISRYV